MKSILINFLKCPGCRSALELKGSSAERNDVSIDTGELVCVNCRHNFPIIAGVPRMMVQEGLIADSCDGFRYQWNKRQHGRAEKKGVVYGYEIGKFMNWFVTIFTPGLKTCPTSGWLLDAGCGTGEKARELARLFPQHQVIAIDQSNSITRTAEENAGVPNLHFVQANVWYPPFAKQSVQFAMSIGVLHHTPDTFRAFNAISEIVAFGGDFMTWLYPLPEEDTFWAGLYRQRDRHFFKLGHRLPNWITMFLCRVYVAIFFPWVLGFLKQQYKINKDRFPIYPDRPSLREVYHSAVFLSFDNVMPTHQFRHGRAEVRQWYSACGFGPVNDTYPGFFHAVRTLGAKSTN